MKSKIAYFDNLNALRAIAAFAVLTSHCILWFPMPDDPFHFRFRYHLGFNQQGSYLGVMFFFVLSGYLITYLLLREIDIKGKLNIWKFYIRRTLRIWPLYYLIIVIGFVIYPAIMNLTGVHHIETANVYLHIFFLSNFDNIYFDGVESRILRVLWTIGVEEQFYIFWPLIFLFIRKSKRIIATLITMFILSESFYISADSHLVEYFHSISCARFLVFGGILGYLSFTHQKYILGIIQSVPGHYIALMYLSGLYILFKSITWFDVNDFIIYIFFGFVILERCYSIHPINHYLIYRVLNWLGVRSYGIYVYHTISIYIIQDTLPINEQYFILYFLLTIVLSIILSHISYIYFEKYFLNMKKKFTRI